MHILIWLAQSQALVSFWFLGVAASRQIQSMVYFKENGSVDTYKGLCHFFLDLLYLSRTRPAGEKTARVVIGIHSKLCAVRLPTAYYYYISQDLRHHSHPKTRIGRLRRLHVIVIWERVAGFPA